MEDGGRDEKSYNIYINCGVIMFVVFLCAFLLKTGINLHNYYVVKDTKEILGLYNENKFSEVIGRLNLERLYESSGNIVENSFETFKEECYYNLMFNKNYIDENGIKIKKVNFISIRENRNYEWNITYKLVIEQGNIQHNITIVLMYENEMVVCGEVSYDDVSDDKIGTIISRYYLSVEEIRD